MGQGYTDHLRTGRHHSAVTAERSAPCPRGQGALRSVNKTGWHMKRRPALCRIWGKRGRKTSVADAPATVSSPVFQVHARKCQRRFQFNPRLTVHLCISEPVQFLRLRKAPFYCLLAVGIPLFHIAGVPVFLPARSILCPYLPRHRLDVCFARCTSIRCGQCPHTFGSLQYALCPSRFVVW